VPPGRNPGDDLNLLAVFAKICRICELAPIAFVGASLALVAYAQASSTLTRSQACHFWLAWNRLYACNGHRH
jgi:hypothetical protein